MSTGQDLVLGAYGQSSKNQPTRIATEGTELLRVVNAVMKGCYAVAARVNPAYFGKSAAVAFVTDSWPYPTDAETVYRIENAAAPPAEVVVVPFDDRKAELGRPAVYLFGRKFYGAGNALDPAAGNLTMYYSMRHPTLASLATGLDASWPTDFDNLPILAIATYLARKDGRAEELAAVASEGMQWLGMYVAHLEHAVAEERRRFGPARIASAGSLVSLAQLVFGAAVMGGPTAGGASS